MVDPCCSVCRPPLVPPGDRQEGRLDRDVRDRHRGYGARRLHRKRAKAGVEPVYEEFPDDHASVDYRMDKSLPFLAKALSE